MLDTVKSYIMNAPDIPFEMFYQKYICEVQDANIFAELKNINSSDITTLQDMISKLNAQLHR